MPITYIYIIPGISHGEQNRLKNSPKRSFYGFRFSEKTIVCLF